MQGREKEAVIISLVRSNDTVSLDHPPSSSSLKYGPWPWTEGGWFPQREKENEWYASPRPIDGDVSQILHFSGHDSSKKTSCEDSLSIKVTHELNFP